MTDGLGNGGLAGPIIGPCGMDMHCPDLCTWAVACGMVTAGVDLLHELHFLALSVFPIGRECVLFCLVNTGTAAAAQRDIAVVMAKLVRRLLCAFLPQKQYW